MRFNYWIDEDYMTREQINAYYDELSEVLEREEEMRQREIDEILYQRHLENEKKYGKTQFIGEF